MYDLYPMSDSRTPPLSSAGQLPDGTAAKRPWHTPKLEQVDYAEAEAGAGGGGDIAYLASNVP